MNKRELIDAATAKVARVSHYDASEVVNATLQVVAERLRAGERVELYAFGNFSVVDRAAHEARNPKTGAPVHVPAKRAVKFKAARALLG